MRVVVDTNVLIAGALWSGPPHHIIELAETGKIVLCATAPMLDELRGVLKRRKFSGRLRTLRTTPDEILASLLPLVELYPPARASGAVPSDPDDEMFVGCAISANADFISSGDDHLLRLKRACAISIVSPAEFLRVLKK